MRLTALVAVLALSSCVVVVEDPNAPSRPPSPPPVTPPPPPPAWTPVVAWEDCRQVILREYIGLEWDAIGACEYYINQWGYDDGDILVLAFIAAWCRVDLHEVVWMYERCRFDLFQVALAYRMTGGEFYVDLPPHTGCPEPYATAYDYLWRGQRHYLLTNDECRALLELRIATHYYGWPPREWFERFERAAEAGRLCREIFTAEYAHCGRGGRGLRGEAIRVAERPWRNRSDYESCRSRREECRRAAERAYEDRKRSGDAWVKQRPPAIAAPGPRATREEWRAVLYREYYGFDSDAADSCDYYIRRWGCDEGDMLVLAFIAARCRMDIHEVAAFYEQAGFDLFQVALRCRMTGDEFFVDVPEKTICPPDYQKAYESYWKRERGYTLTNEECRSLVELRIAIDYYGWAPREWFDRYEACCEAMREPREAFVTEAQRCGRGGRNARTETVVMRERPWANPREREATRAKREECDRATERLIEERKKTGKSGVSKKPPQVTREHARPERGEAERSRLEEERRRAAEEARGRAAQEERCRRAIKDLCDAIDLFCRERGCYPEEGAPGLARCLSERSLNRRPFYMFEPDQRDTQGQAIDPWGRPLHFKVHAPNFPGNKDDRKAKNKKAFDLSSFGPNGRDDDGAGDDIANWNERTEPESRRACEEEEEAKRKAEQERARGAEEAKRWQRADEEKRRKAEEAQKRAEEARRRQEEERANEEKRRKGQEERKQAEEEARRQQQKERERAEEEKRRKEEAERKRAEEEARRQQQEEKERADEERRHKDEEERKRAEEERQRKDKEKDKEKEKGHKEEPKKEPPGQEKPASDEEKIAAMRAFLEELRQAVERYFGEHRQYPASGAANLVKALESKSRRGQPYYTFAPERLDKDGNLIDAWGQVFHYRNNRVDHPRNRLDKTAFNKKTYDLGSAGPNGKMEGGTEDDIVNWNPKEK
ncbi:MAG: hypothetical protein HYY16_01115 [Planctomycetes bacterium]|nr:hypothetical protein [Planctomycetota bacterium]